MGSLIIRRLMSTFIVLFAVSVLVFGLLQILPGDATIALLTTDATAEEYARVRHALGLDKPVYVRYANWLGHVLRGDLGRSITSQQPVGELLKGRLKATILLTATGMSVAIAVGMTGGIVAAVRPRSVIDRLTTLLALFGNSTPVFWLGLMFILLFSRELGWLPTSGMQTTGRESFVDLLAHLAMPAMTVGLVSAASTARLVRSSMLDVLRQEYVTVARAKGLPERRVNMRHALRNALLPTLTVMGLQVGQALSGAVITETVFAWPGIGSLIYRAISNRDLPLVIGGVLLTAVTFVFINLIVDILYAYVDPRIRYA